MDSVGLITDSLGCYVCEPEDRCTLPPLFYLTCLAQAIMRCKVTDTWSWLLSN